MRNRSELFDTKWIGKANAPSLDRAIDIAPLLKPKGTEQSAGSTPPTCVLFLGGPGAGKTRIRHNACIDRVSIDVGDLYNFITKNESVIPQNIDDLLDKTGRNLAITVLSQRRDCAVEMIGAEGDKVKHLLDGLLAIGYKCEVRFIHCDIAVAWERNLTRGPHNISTTFTERQVASWMFSAIEDVLRRG